MKKIVSFMRAVVIDGFVAIPLFLGGSYLSLGVFGSDEYTLLSVCIFFFTCILSILYLLCTNIKMRSLGFLLVGYEYSCEKGKWRIFVANFIYYFLAFTFIFADYSKMTLLFYVSEILWLIDYIGFFIPGINNRFSVHLLGVNFNKRIVEKKDKICI